MTHEIYSTEAFVLGSEDSGEASREYTLFTEQFGTLTAKATSVRLMKSKLRTNLYDFAHVNLGFVRGKYAITITDAREIRRHAFLTWGPNTTLFAILATFVCRMIPHENIHTAVWRELMRVADVLGSREFTASELRTAEAVFKVRVLSDLGYIPETPEHFTLPIAESLIEQAVRESHL